MPEIIADAEHDRDRGQHRAQLAAQQPPQRDPDHSRTPRFIASRTSPAVRRPAGRARPGRRPGTASGRRCAAARASWVTITSSGRSSSTASRSSCRISALVVESRLPVGSSAKTTVGLRHQGAGDRHALLLAARELGRAVLAAVGQPDLARSPVDPRRARACGRRSCSGSRMFSSARQHRQQVEELEHEPDVVAAQLGELLVVHARDRRARRSRPCPWWAVSSPARMCISVDFPEPGRPHHRRELALGMSSVTPRRASTPRLPRRTGG